MKDNDPLRLNSALKKKKKTKQRIQARSGSVRETTVATEQQPQYKGSLEDCRKRKESQAYKGKTLPEIWSDIQRPPPLGFSSIPFWVEFKSLI
jgi:hypothetical protein